MYVGDTTPESRKNWIAALDRLAALNPAIVVAGHKKPGAPDSPSTIQDTKRYLQDFDKLQKAAASDQELFDQMTELYPHWVANQSWLMFGSRSYRLHQRRWPVRAHFGGNRGHETVGTGNSGDRRNVPQFQ